MVNSCVMFEQIFCIVWATFVYLWFVAAWCDLLRLCCNLFVTFVTCLWLCYGCCNLFETFWKLFETVLKLFETVCDWLRCFVTVWDCSRLVVFCWISVCLLGILKNTLIVFAIRGSWLHWSSHSGDSFCDCGVLAALVQSQFVCASVYLLFEILWERLIPKRRLAQSHSIPEKEVRPKRKFSPPPPKLIFCRLYNRFRFPWNGT